MSMSFVNHIIVGASGRLGQGLLRALDKETTQAPTKVEYSRWVDSNTAESYLRRISERSVVHVAAGIIDPKASADDIRRINIELPASIAKAIAGTEHRLATYGSVMEYIIPLEHMNTYISGKLELSHALEEARSKEGLDVVHFRLHTLYGGGAPSPFMFAGAMYKAIRMRAPFKMTNGLQFREYHHVDDEVAAILSVIDNQPAGTMELSHGAPVSLRDLATFVFDAYDALELLEIGALPDPVSDYFDSANRSDIPLLKTPFRDACAGVVNWFRTLDRTT